MNKVRKLAVVLVSLLGPIAANADLIDLGDVTHDTNTGIDWLDLTVTTGLSGDDFLAGALGLLDDGWSIATGDQVSILFESNTGLSQGTVSTDFLNLLFGGYTMNLLGCTLSVNTDLCDYSTTDPDDPLLFASLGSFDDGDARLGLAELVIRVENYQPRIGWDLFGDFYARDRREPQVGIFLTKTVSVPEPGTLALLGIGLFGMAAARRRKKV